MKKHQLFFVVSFFVHVSFSAQTVSDIDGNIYNTITIGSQVWTQENLSTTHFSNGDPIPTSLVPVNNDSTSIYQWSFNDDTSYIADYGRLYSWFAVKDNRNVCPAGWHVPGDTEWHTLISFLGGDSLAGDKMKETGTTHWIYTNSQVTNSSGFTGLPGGGRYNPSGYSNLTRLGTFWSSTPWGAIAFPRAYVYTLRDSSFFSSYLTESVAVGNCGFSVRCISNVPAGVNDLKQGNKTKIFPNPASHQFTIITGETENCIVSVYSITGSVLHQQSISGKVNLIDISMLPPGFYVVRIAGDDFVEEKKLVVD